MLRRVSGSIFPLSLCTYEKTREETSRGCASAEHYILNNSIHKQNSLALFRQQNAKPEEVKEEQSDDADDKKMISKSRAIR